MEKLYDLLISILSGSTASTLIQGVNESTRGHICEAILRISLSLHIHPKNGEYVDGLIPNPRSKRLLLISDNLKYLTKSNINNSSNTGKIDAAWCANGKFTLVSSKIKNKITSLDELDVTYLDDCIYRQRYSYNGVPISVDMFDVCVIVLDKKHILDKIKSATTNDIKTRLNKENIYDINDLDVLCRIIQARASGSADPIGSLTGDSRKHLNLRFHQELIHTKAKKVLDNKSGSKILVGAIPRSGKTYIGAKLCLGFSKILVITTRPSETKGAWIDVFKNHREFSDYTIDELTNQNEDTVCITDDKIVIVSSKQFFDHDERKKKTFGKWDVILIDEIHEGGCTELFMSVLKNNTTNTTHHIMMTATYDKPIMRFNIPTTNQFYWDLEDVRLMKNWSIESESRLVDKYGHDVLAVKSKFEKEKKSISGDYDVFPDPILLTTSMHEDYYKDMMAFNLSQDDTEVGFSMRALFMTTKDGKAFQNPKAVQRFLELVSGSTYEKTRMSMFDRIQRVWNMYHHRNNDTFKTMMWFLPYGDGQLLDNVKGCLAKHISQNPVLKNYSILLLDSGMSDIKNRVKYLVEDAKHKDGKDGVILLTGDVGSLGLSLPEVDVVFLLNNIQSSDKNFQQMMRCLTEENDKKCSIIVDFNVWRVLNTISTYAIGRCGKVFSNTKDKISWCITNLIRVDVDLWDCPEAPSPCTKDSLVEQLSVQWTRMMENSGVRLAALQKQYADIGDDQSLINKFSKFTASGSSTEKKEYPDGISETRSEDSDTESVKSEKKKELPKNININDILARLIPEIALLSGGNLSLVNAVKYIKSQPSMRDAMSQFLLSMSEA